MILMSVPLKNKIEAYEVHNKKLFLNKVKLVNINVINPMDMINHLSIKNKRYDSLFKDFVFLYTFCLLHTSKF